MQRPKLRDTVQLKPGECATLGFFHEYAISVAMKAFEEGRRREPYMTPFLWLLRSDSTVVSVETRWANDHEKDQVSAAMRMLMKMTDTTAYSFIHEAWMANWNSDGSGSMPEPPGEGYMSVSGLPAQQREDVLLIWTFGKGPQTYRTRYGIARANTPHSSLKVRDDMEPDGHAEGRFWNLLL